MRKIILGFTALFAVLAILGLSAPANAEVTRTATFTVTQPSGQFSQFDRVFTHVFSVDVDANGTFTGTGVITDENGNFFSNEAVTGAFSNSDTQVSLHVDGRSLGDGVVWDLNNAPMNGTYVTGSLVGNPDYLLEFKVFEPTFTNVTPPAPVLGNHGECVSGATHAGIKGQALAAIAKVVTKVGPYGSATCPKV